MTREERIAEIERDWRIAFPEDLRWLLDELRAADEKLREIRKCVDEQAEDDALWCVPAQGLQRIAEAYLQQELRRLHAVIEGEVKS